MPNPYSEPRLAIAVLDYSKPIETYMCLRSVKDFVKVPHTVILCDNGSGEDYGLRYLQEGLADQLVVNRDSRGLGLGTRDLFSLIHARWTIYLQNDQVFGRDFTEQDFDSITANIGRIENWSANRSISLAGAPCGHGIYSERAHLIETGFYKLMERAIPLGHHGAGKYHDGVWRERQIQDYYAKNGFVHVTNGAPHVIDNGVFAVRDMGEGGLWCHRTDTKRVWCIRVPVARNPAYPKFTDEEYTLAAAGKWPEQGAIPQQEILDSFDCWGPTALARMEVDYIRDLRRRKGSQ